MVIKAHKAVCGLQEGSIGVSRDKMEEGMEKAGDNGPDCECAFI